MGPFGLAVGPVHRMNHMAGWATSSASRCRVGSGTTSVLVVERERGVLPDINRLRTRSAVKMN